jgi:hypothetical protein
LQQETVVALQQVPSLAVAQSAAILDVDATHPVIARSAATKQSPSAETPAGKIATSQAFT